MKQLEQLFKKKKKLIVGVISGTSADGVDAVLVEVNGTGIHTDIRQLAFATYPYPKQYKNFLLKNSDTNTARLEDIARLDMLIAEFFAQAVRKIVRKSRKRIEEIDLIGSHGQTICHLPDTHQIFGRNIRATLQIGNPSAIAKLTGVTTIGDFRIGDVAVGGTGAPLVPYFDYLILRSQTKNRAALNIGGIANITVLPKHCDINQVLAFDTGPGNMVIDGLTEKFFHQPFDNHGIIALRGNMLPKLLRWMISHPYMNIKPPKSTGRELFGELFIKQILAKTKGERRQDIIATATEFTALSIYNQYLHFIRKRTRLDELIVSGGGTHNIYLMNALRRYFNGVTVMTTDETGTSSDAKEAICFALLANETIAGNSSNIPGATGAKKQTILGTICLP